MKEKIIGVINRIKAISGIKKISETKNINELARMVQNKTAFLAIASVGVLVFIGWFFMFSASSKEKDSDKKSNTKQEVVQMDGTADTQFTQDASQKALEEQQWEIKSLNEKLTDISDQMDFLQKNFDEKKQEELNDSKVAIQELQTKTAELEVALKKSGGRLPTHAGSETEIGSSTRGITTTNFSYTDQAQSTSAVGDINIGLNPNIKAKTTKNYAPPGTFAKAVLLSGADTNAGVHGQTDTIPIIMRILDNGTLPNGAHSSLKGCFVTAAAYGDASSERGQIRLQRLSCVRKPKNYVLDIPIEGTINDMGGSDGIRGHVVMRNHKLIWNAGVSGFLSGIGNAMQQSTTTQAISPLGVTNTIKSGKAFEYGAFSGTNTALGKLADYYIKLADMYHPIVQVHAGSQVNIVFLKGFSLTEGLGIPEQDESEKTKRTETINNAQGNETSDFMQSIKNSHLGQPVAEQPVAEQDVNNNTNNEDIQ